MDRRWVYPACMVLALSLCACTVADEWPDSPAVPFSRALRPATSSGDASGSSGKDAAAAWRSRGVPASLAFDLAAARAHSVHKVLVAWYNDATYGYDHALLGQPGYNNLGSYEIQLADDAGGTGPWRRVVRVEGNTRHSREHLVDIGTARWLRIQVERVDGSPGNTDAMAHVDLHDASAVPVDGWLFVGDSITANGMGHGAMAGTGGFPGELERRAGRFPAQENAGMPGWTLEDASQQLPAWLDDFPGRYVPLAFGTNDAAADASPAEFGSRLAGLARLVHARGKVAILPTIPWSRDPYHAARIPALNEQIARIAGHQPDVLPGPDLYALFQGRQELVSGDGIHPTAEGYAALRQSWVDWAASNIYKAVAAGSASTATGERP